MTLSVSIYMIEFRKRGIAILLMYTALIDDEKDQLCFTNIYNSYRKQMLLAAQRVLNSPEEAEDAVQVALLGIAQRIKSIPTGNPLKLRAYVLTAAKNAALSVLSKKQQWDNMLDVSDLTLPAEDNLFQQVMASHDYALLLRAIRQLAPPYQEVLLYICVQEQSVRETAAVLHRREGTVRQQLNRGKRLLIELCRKEGMCFVQEHIDAI